MTYKNGRQLVDDRYDVLRGGAKICELQAVGNTTVRMQAGAKVKTAFSGRFRQNESVNFLSDIIRPMHYSNGAWVPLGLFAVANVTEDRVDDTGEVDVDARDQGMLAQRRTVEESLVIPRGEPYTEAVQKLLAECGLEKIRCEDSSLRLQTDRADWEIGTPYLDIIDQFLTEINYADLWFDAEGYARIEAADASGDRVDHEYRADAYSIIDPGYQVETNIYGSYNVFIALVSSPDLEQPMKAMAENSDPASPLSTVNLGRIPAPVYRVDNIASQEELQKYVDNLRNKSMIAIETVSFSTAIQMHGVGDLVALSHHGMRGNYRETDWEITLGKDGEMTHKARKERIL